jgi:hypothetical protein
MTRPKITTYRKCHTPRCPNLFKPRTSGQIYCPRCLKIIKGKR